MRYRNMPQSWRPKAEKDRASSKVKQITPRLLIEDYDALKAYAKEDGVSVSRYAQRVLERHIRAKREEESHG